GGSAEVRQHYGPLKPASERAVEEAFDGPVLVVRAGFIVGRCDWTGRFGWWIRRVARGGRVLMPAGWRVQIVHAGDLADWMLAMAQRGAGGIFNATSAPTPMLEVLEEARRASGSDAELVPVDASFLREHGVELPLWSD